MSKRAEDATRQAWARRLRAREIVRDWPELNGKQKTTIKRIVRKSRKRE